MDVQIPLYRAKRLDSDEYVEGYFYKDSKYPLIINHSWTDLDNSNGIYLKAFQIDLSTLAIHFPDMIDSEGNKIFASLNEKYNGGDILKSDLGVPFNTIFNKDGYQLRNGKNLARYDNWNPERTFKVVGIQK